MKVGKKRFTIDLNVSSDDKRITGKYKFIGVFRGGKFATRKLRKLYYLHSWCAWKFRDINFPFRGLSRKSNGVTLESETLADAGNFHGPEYPSSAMQIEKLHRRGLCVLRIRYRLALWFCEIDHFQIIFRHKRGNCGMYAGNFLSAIFLYIISLGV